MKKITLKSDGTPANTLITTEDGLELGNVQGVSWELFVGEFAKARIETILTPVELEFLQKKTEIIFTMSQKQEDRNDAIVLLDFALDAMWKGEELSEGLSKTEEWWVLYNHISAAKDLLTK